MPERRTDRGQPPKGRKPSPARPGGQVSPHDENLVNEASKESFPASDPPSFTSVTHTGNPKKPPQKS